MKISEYNKVEYTEELKAKINGFNKALDFDLSNPIQINTPSLINNNIVSKITDSLSKMYRGGYLDDLNKEQLSDIMQSDLHIRNKNIVFGKWMLSILNKVDDLVVKGHKLSINNPVIKAFDEHGDFSKIYDRLMMDFSIGLLKSSSWVKGVIRYTGVGDNHSFSVSRYDKDLKTVKYESHSIVIGDKDDGELTDFKNIAEKNGLTEADMIESVFLHEFSHTVHRLRINDASIIDSEIMRGIEVPLKSNKWMVDNFILGIASDNNAPYVVNKEVYADTRGILMYGKLHPEKFEGMLASVIEWRKGSIGTDHDTYLGLLKLKEFIIGKDVTQMDSNEIHKVSFSLANMISVAKVKQFILDDVNMDGKFKSQKGYEGQKPLIENRIVAYNVSQKEESNKITRSDFIDILDFQVKKNADILGISADTIHYKDYQKSIDNKGIDVLRDRVGFEIKGVDIYIEKILMGLEYNNRMIVSNLYDDVQKAKIGYDSKLLGIDLKKVILDVATDGLSMGIIPGDDLLLSATIALGNKYVNMMKNSKSNSFGNTSKEVDIFIGRSANYITSHLYPVVNFTEDKLKIINGFFNSLHTKTEDEIRLVIDDIIESRKKSYDITGAVVNNSIDIKKDNNEVISSEINPQLFMENISKGWKERKALLDSKTSTNEVKKINSISI